MISVRIINKPCLLRTLMNAFWRAFSSGKKLDIALESLRARALSSLVDQWASQSTLNSLNIGWRSVIGIVAVAEGRLQQKPFWDVEVCKLCIVLGIPSAKGDSFGKWHRKVMQSAPKSSEVGVGVCGFEHGATGHRGNEVRELEMNANWDNIQLTSRWSLHNNMELPWSRGVWENIWQQIHRQQLIIIDDIWIEVLSQVSVDGNGNFPENKGIWSNAGLFSSLISLLRSPTVLLFTISTRKIWLASSPSTKQLRVNFGCGFSWIATKVVNSHYMRDLFALTSRWCTHNNMEVPSSGRVWEDLQQLVHGQQWIIIDDIRIEVSVRLRLTRIETFQRTRVCVLMCWKVWLFFSLMTSLRLPTVLLFAILTGNMQLVSSPSTKQLRLSVLDMGIVGQPRENSSKSSGEKSWNPCNFRVAKNYVTRYHPHDSPANS